MATASSLSMATRLGQPTPLRSLEPMVTRSYGSSMRSTCNASHRGRTSKRRARTRSIRIKTLSATNRRITGTCQKLSRPTPTLVKSKKCDDGWEARGLGLTTRLEELRSFSAHDSDSSAVQQKTGRRAWQQATDPVVVDLYAANMGAGTSGNGGETGARDGETIGQMWERFKAIGRPPAVC